MPPFSCAKARNQVLYAVNGAGRGFRWHPSFGKQDLGMSAPATAPSVRSIGAASASLCVTGITPMAYVSDPFDEEELAGKSWVEGTHFTEVPIRFKHTPTLQSAGGGGQTSTFGGVIEAGAIASLNLAVAGSGHATAPSVTIAGDGTGAKASAIIADGTVVGAIVTDGGSGYTKATATALAAGPITAAQAKGVLRAGLLSGATITNPGGGFGSTPSFTVSYKSDSDATITCTLANGYVNSIAISSGGAGYSSATVSIAAPTNPSGVTATATAVVSGGAVTAINVVSKGERYTSVPAVTISGDGTGATAAAVCYFGLSLSVSSPGDSYAQGIFNKFSGAGDQIQHLSFSGHTGPGPGSYTVPGAAQHIDRFMVNDTGGLLTVSTSAHGFLTAPTSVTVTRIAVPKITSYLTQSAAGSAKISMEAGLSGRYLCCYRFVDSTADAFGGPVPSDISPFAEVEAGAGSSALAWSVSRVGADTRATHVELFRSTSDQALVLYRIARIPLSSFTGDDYSYSDTTPDYFLSNEGRADYLALPVVLPNGQVNARRHGKPPENKKAICQFQDRTWFGADTSGSEPNTLYFSEIDEPESVPSVNSIVIQENSRSSDAVQALIPFGDSLLVPQRRHLYRIKYNALPIIDAQISLVASRGILNDRCWDTFGGVAAIADSSGIYLFDGSAVDPISDPIANYWRDGIVDLANAELFSLRYDSQSEVLRFFYRTASDTGTTRAACYSPLTKAWWEETYPIPVTAASHATVGGKETHLLGGYSGGVYRFSGVTDGGQAVPYAIRTGNLAIADEPDRTIRILYAPTATSETVGLSMFYNNSQTPRPNAISSTRDFGVQTQLGNAVATIDLSSSRSALGNATGMASVRFAGRMDERSVGADRHIAIQFSGDQTSSAVKLFGVAASGVS